MEVIMVPTLMVMVRIKSEMLPQCLAFSKCSINAISLLPMLFNIYFYYPQNAVGKTVLTH